MAEATTADVRAACAAQGIGSEAFGVWVRELVAEALDVAADALGDTQLSTLWGAVRWLRDPPGGTPWIVELVELVEEGAG